MKIFQILNFMPVIYLVLLKIFDTYILSLGNYIIHYVYIGIIDNLQVNVITLTVHF